MIHDLKTQELVNSGYGLLVCAADFDLTARRGLLVAVMNLISHLCHGRAPRRFLSMDEHGSIEVSRREHPRDVRKMAANLLACLRVLGTVRPHRDDATV